MATDLMNGINNISVKDKNMAQEDIVDPWNVVSTSDTGIDYNKLIST